MAQGTMLGQKGGSGSITGLNVFAQLNEPSKKEGIWIKTSETVIDENTTLPEISKYEFDGIKIVNSFGNDYCKLKNKGYDFVGGSVCIVGTKIYLFGGGNNSASYNSVRVYDIINDEYNILANMPFKSSANIGIAVGTNIYLFNRQ